MCGSIVKNKLIYRCHYWSTIVVFLNLIILNPIITPMLHVR